MGENLPYETNCAVATGALGTEVCWKVARVQTVKNTICQFQIIPQFLEPAYRFRTWQDSKRGFNNGIPKDWYRVNWICPADYLASQRRAG